MHPGGGNANSGIAFPKKVQFVTSRIVVDILVFLKNRDAAQVVEDRGGHRVFYQLINHPLLLLDRNPARRLAARSEASYCVANPRTGWS
jgi:hypothetical protein